MTSESYRILHTADWHLGKKLYDQDRQDEHVAFFAFLLKTIVERNIDALLIAGDIYDSTNPHASVKRLYYDFLAELRARSPCAVIVISGNHDSPADLDAPKELLKNLNIHVIGSLSANIEDHLVLLPTEFQPKVVIAALPFLRDKDLRVGLSGQTQEDIRKSIQEGISKRYQDIYEAAKSYEGAALIATGHLTVLGGSKSESEREIHIGGLGAISSTIFSNEFCYVALGHLHRPQNIDQNEAIRYSGSPIALSFSEAQDIKEIRYLEFIDGKLKLNEAIKIPLKRKLFQIRTTLKDLEKTLINFNPEVFDWHHWVELIIKTDEPTDHLHDYIENLILEKPYKIIKKVIENTNALEGLHSSSCSDLNLGDLLGDPIEVFSKRLDQASIHDEQERAQLITAFSELYEIVNETQRKSSFSQSVNLRPVS